MKLFSIILLIVGLVPPNCRASTAVDYRAEVIRALVASDLSFLKNPVRVRFTAPEYAFVKELPPFTGMRIQNVVFYEFANDRNSGGFSTTGFGFAVVDDGKVTFVDTSRYEIEWFFGKPALQPKLYFSGIGTIGNSSASGSKNLPNHFLDLTAPSVTPPAEAGGAPSVAADH